MASSVDRIRDVVKSSRLDDSTSLDGKDVAAAAAERYQDAYFMSPAEYEEKILMERIARLPEDDPRRLALASGSLQDLSPDATFAALTAGLPGNAEFVQGLRDYDQAVAAAQIQAAQDARVAEQQADVAAREQQASEDWADWGLFGALKTATRAGFIGLSAPIEVISNTYRAYGGWMTGEGDTTGAADMVEDIFAGTQLGALADEWGQGNFSGLDTGDGWFGLDPNSKVGQDMQRRQADLWTLSNGDIATFGRSLAMSFGMDKGTTAYDLTSGLGDAAFYVFDPSMYVGAAQIKGVASVAKGAIQGGKEGAAAARAVQSGEAIGQGVDAARTALSNVDEAAARLDELARGRNELQATYRQAQRTSEATAAAKANADANLLQAEQVRLAEQDKALAARVEIERLTREQKAKLDAELKQIDAEEANLDLLEESLTNSRQWRDDAAAKLPTEESTAAEATRGATATPVPNASEDAVFRVRDGLPRGVITTDEAASELSRQFANLGDDAAKARVDTVRESLRKGVITQNEATQELTGLANVSTAVSATKKSRALASLAEQRKALAVRRAKAYVSVADEQLTEALRVEAAAKAARDAAAKQVDEFIAETKAKYSAPDADLPLSQEQALRETLRSDLGFYRTMDGRQQARVDLALQSIFSGKLDPVLRAISKIDDEALIFQMTRGKIADPAIAKALAQADTVERVRAVFAGALGRGQLNPSVGRLRALRTYARVMPDGRSTAGHIRLAERAFGVTARGLRWSMNATERRTPWSYDVHLEDAAQFVRAMGDTAYYAMKGASKAERLAFENRWIRAAMSASDGVARKELAFQMQNEIAEFALRKGGIDPKTDLGKEIMQAVRGTRAAQNDLVGYNVDEIEQAYKLATEKGADVATLKLGDEVVEMPTRHLPMLASAFNDRFHFADPRKMQRLVKTAKSLKKNGGLKDPNGIARLYSTLFDDYWRTLVLLRVSYVVRNTMEEQARMALSRQPNLFTSPLTALGTISQGRRFERLFSRFTVGDLDVTGAQLKPMQELDDAASEAFGEFHRDILDDSGALLDIGTPAFAERQALAGFQRVPKPALGDTGEGVTAFWNGAANEVMMLNHDELARTVRRVMRGDIPKKVRAHMEKTGLTAKEAVVDLSMKGEFGAAIGKLQTAAARRNPSLSSALGKQDGVMAFLFDQNNPFSYASRWNRYANGLDDNLVKLLDEERFLVPPKYKDGDVAAQATMKELGKNMRSLFGGKNIDSYAVDVTAAPIYVREGVSEPNIFRRSTDAFFSSTGKFMRATGVTPEIQYAYWESAARYVSGMDPESATKLVAIAEETLGGLTSTWAARQLSQIKKAAKKADGALTQKEVHRLAESDAWIKAEELFYVAKKRNMLSHQLRFVFPFAQAWGNSLKVYSKLLAQNSQVGYRAGVLVNALKGEGSNSIYEVLGSIPMDPLGVSMYDPEQGFLYNDRQGRLSMQLPFFSTGMDLLANGVSLATGNGTIGRRRLDTNLQSMNMLFQGGAGPGFSPVAQAGMTAVRSTSGYNMLPEGLQVFDNPLIKAQTELYDDPNNPASGPINDFLASLIPGPAKGLLEAAGAGITQDSKKYVAAMQANLLAEKPQNYLVDGVLTAESQSRLAADADRAAKTLNLAHTIFRFASPGTLSVEAMISDGNGNVIPLLLVGAEFQEALARHDFDKALAVQEMIDTYGVGVVGALVAPKDSIGFMPSDVAYDFYMKNPGLNVDPSTTDMFFSGGRYSREFAKLAREQSGAEIKTPAELAADAAAMLYAAERDKLQTDYANGLVSDAQYKQRAFDIDRRWSAAVPEGYKSTVQQRIAKVEEALDQPGIETAPAYSSISEYIKYRNIALDDLRGAGAGSVDLGTQLASPWRVWLQGLADGLLARDPSFKDAHELFSRELKETD